MSRKTYLEQACIAVPEFKTISEQFLRKYTIAGKSESCTRNYLMQISKLVLHFGCSPLELSVDQLEEYLFLVAQNEKPSMSSFKHLVYGLRTMFAMFKKEKLLLELPSIAQSKSLPTVLSQKEVRQLLKHPRLLKHKVLFAVIYDLLQLNYRTRVKLCGNYFISFGLLIEFALSKEISRKLIKLLYKSSIRITISYSFTNFGIFPGK